MSQEAIFTPFLGMMLLTVVVWLVMMVSRIIFMSAEKIDGQQVQSPDQFYALAPARIAASGHNFRNLLEVPVLFYGICLYLFVTGQVDTNYIYAAYTFLAFRVIHSLIQCTVNIVNLRFLAYLVSSIAAAYMIVRATISVL
ncbi:hypothetical protein EOPP23_11125 [Endozoicomonas sp. OPT23]|uniref:MAPEG family protein n=1 Tax=Endozoicomonas sp. OPT23 TaxID=2072845 RepID=UPI00129B1E85|nr:MAPEG family protein [Endozoicomonas sp. OPT23]MRI33537.1 hypothetical protein [Endozoicomonas sp. OPT23]